MTIGIHPSGQYTNFRCNVEYMRYASRHDETIGYLALGDDDGSIGSTQRNAGEARGGRGRLEGIFHLIESTLGGEDGDVMIVVAIA